MEVNTSVNGRMAKWTDKVLFTMAKKVNGQVINTLVNLGMANRHGQGSYFSADGGKYIGEWKDDKLVKGN